MNGAIVLPAVEILYENSHSSNMIILLLSVLIFLNKRASDNPNLTKPRLWLYSGNSLELFYEIETGSKISYFISAFDLRHIFVDFCLFVRVSVTKLLTLWRYGDNGEKC